MQGLYDVNQKPRGGSIIVREAMSMYPGITSVALFWVKYSYYEPNLLSE